jgi:hypothetical protein
MCFGRHLPVIQDWRLNERMYGGLQGLNKSETVAKHGEEQVLLPHALTVNARINPHFGHRRRHRRHYLAFRARQLPNLPLSRRCSSGAAHTPLLLPPWRRTTSSTLARRRSTTASLTLSCPSPSPSLTWSSVSCLSGTMFLCPSSSPARR